MKEKINKLICDLYINLSNASNEYDGKEIDLRITDLRKFVVMLNFAQCENDYFDQIKDLLGNQHIEDFFEDAIKVKSLIIYLNTKAYNKDSCSTKNFIKISDYVLDNSVKEYLLRLEKDFEYANRNRFNINQIETITEILRDMVDYTNLIDYRNNTNYTADAVCGADIIANLLLSCVFLDQDGKSLLDEEIRKYFELKTKELFNELYLDFTLEELYSIQKYGCKKVRVRDIWS